MSRVITFSRTFPSYHPRAGEPTYFVEKIWASIGCFFDQLADEDRLFNPRLSLDSFEPKNQDIRAGHKWKVGDWFSPRVWSGKPNHSKQIIIAPDIQVKKQWDFDLINDKLIIGGLFHCHLKQDERIEAFASNDGLNAQDLLDWFKYPKESCDHQIICWNEKIEY